jgi:microcystin-dependent protein
MSGLKERAADLLVKPKDGKIPRFRLGTVTGLLATGKVSVRFDASDEDVPVYPCPGIASGDRCVVLSLNRSLKFAISSIRTCQYAIDDLYFTTSSVHPETRWPGTTWQAWGQGRVPVGMGSNGATNYTTVETTGGADSVQLSSAQNGKHTHVFTGTAGNTGNQSTGHTHTIPNHQHSIRHNNNSGSAGVAWGFSTYSGQTKYETSNTQSDGGGGATSGVSANHTHGFTPSGINADSGSGSAHENRMPYETCYIWKRIA